MVEEVGANSEEGTLIKSTVKRATEISKDYAKTIQDEENVLIKVPTAASDRGLDIKKEYGVSEAMGEALSKLSLISP